MEPCSAKWQKTLHAEIALQPVCSFVGAFSAGCAASEGWVCEILYVFTDILFAQDNIGIYGAYAIADALCRSSAATHNKAENDKYFC